MPLVQQQPEAAGEINTLLGKGSEFEGKLTFEGTVRIDGKLAGEIFTDDVLGACRVAPGARAPGATRHGREDLVLASETLYASSHTPGAMLRETAGGATFDARYNCSLYRRGDVDDAVFPFCGDGVCDPVTETAAACPADCSLACGDGTCGAGEDCAACPADCGPCPDGGVPDGGGGGDGGVSGDAGSNGSPGDGGGAAELGGGCSCTAGARRPVGRWGFAGALLLALLGGTARRAAQRYS